MRSASLLLLPGLDGTGIMFRPLKREFNANYELRIMSYPQRSDYGYERLVDVVRSNLPQKGFFILGESFSGPIALRIANERPAGLRGIILCATFAKNPLALFPSSLRFLVAAPLFMVWPVSLKLNVLTSFKVDAEIKELMKEVKQLTNNSVLAARAREALRVNVVKELKECPYPILYLCGKRDIVVPKHNIESMLMIKRDIQVRYLNTSHLVLQEAPHDAAVFIKNFIDSNMPHNQTTQTTGGATTDR